MSQVEPVLVIAVGVAVGVSWVWLSVSSGCGGCGCLWPCLRVPDQQEACLVVVVAVWGIVIRLEASAEAQEACLPAAP